MIIYNVRKAVYFLKDELILYFIYILAFIHMLTY